jgi:isopentenyldiphosphate isomerase
MNDKHPLTEEILEEWSWEKAVPTGRPVPRGKAHKEGIAHEGVHLWVIKKSAGKTGILFQRRAGHKESYPDYLDITVGGHVPFGKNEGKIQKEASEEIGISPPDSELFDLGYFRYEETTDKMFHREFQRVYLHLDGRPLEAYVFNDG